MKLVGVFRSRVSVCDWFCKKSLTPRFTKCHLFPKMTFWKSSKKVTFLKFVSIWSEWHWSFLNLQFFLLKSVLCIFQRISIKKDLKELYTSISTLAQKLVLTLLDNEFILKILISTPFGQKIRKRFRLKNHKSQISGVLSGFRALL